MGEGSAVTACIWTKNVACRHRSGSFKITPMSRARVSSYPMQVQICCTVNVIFNVKYWRDLEIRVWGRSWNMAPINRSYDFILVCRCNYSSIMGNALFVKLLWPLVTSHLRVTSSNDCPETRGTTNSSWQVRCYIQHYLSRPRIYRLCTLLYHVCYHYNITWKRHVTFSVDW